MIIYIHSNPQFMTFLYYYYIITTSTISFEQLQTQKSKGAFPIGVVLDIPKCRFNVL